MANNIVSELQKCEKTKITLNQNQKEILREIYNNIINCAKFVKKTKKKGFFIQLDNVHNIHQLSEAARGAEEQYMPEAIGKYIRSNTDYMLNCLYIVNNKRIRITFYFMEEFTPELKVLYLKYVDIMLIWLIYASRISKPGCLSKWEMTVDIYLTPFKKELPEFTKEVLGPNNINSAFCYRCGGSQQGITIFREEEWFKVFLHETFHYFGFDSALSSIDLNRNIGKLFSLDIDFSVYEGYCDFWARFLQCVFISYNETGNKSFDAFSKLCNNYLNVERFFTCFQSVKTLKYMGLTYSDLYTEGKSDMYKEKTHVFGYYTVTNILFNNFGKFLEWCALENTNMFIVKNNTDPFYKYIKNNYKDPALLETITNCEKCFMELLQKEQLETLNTTRMSSLDLKLKND